MHFKRTAEISLF